MKKVILSLALCWIFQGLCSAEMQTVVVLPFPNHSSTPGMHWMSESFPELLEERLRWPNLNILGREERLLAFDRIGIPYSSALSKASLIKIGEELDADLLIVGEFDSNGKEIQASASILDLRKRLLKPLIQQSGALDEFQMVCGRVAWKVLSQIDPTFPLSLNTFLSRFPVIPNVAFENYVRGLVESDRTKQIRFFRQADKAYPNYTKAIFQLGKLYHHEKDYPTSSLWLQRMIKLDGEVHEARFLQGLNYLYLRSYEKAASEFLRLSQLIPLNEVYCNLGIARSLAGARQEATDALQKAIDGDPSEAEYYFNLAYHLWKLGSFAEALKNLRAAADRSDGDGEAQYLMYKCYQALGQPDESAAAFALAKQASPKVANWESRRQMPDLFRIQSNFDELSFRQIQLQIRRVQDSKTEPQRVRDQIASDLNLASEHLRMKRLDQAERLVALTIQRAPESAEARQLMGRVLEAKGEKDRAVAEFRTSLWLKESAHTRVLLSKLYLALERREDAQTQARLALELEPGNREAEEILSKVSSP
jgi:tetratricopeptide (TPR) repeat protein